MEYDYVIVGAGLAGSVFAERLASLKKKILIIEKRDHIGGNCFDYYNSDGILVHKYGPHWFHTNSKIVVKYLSDFTQWRIHEHRVKSSINGRTFPFPINMTTLNKLYGLNLTTSEEVQAFYDKIKIPIARPQNAEEMVTSQIGSDLYNLFYKNYTYKQWRCDPKSLSPSITNRIPIRTNSDDRYFSDTFQGIPLKGYTNTFQAMLNRNNISLLLNTDYKNILNDLKFKHLIYTGSIDYFFDNIHGELPYRSLKFEHQTLQTEFYQECQQINYPNDFEFTRIIEWKHATGQKHHKTTITKEYPCFSDKENEPLYPIPTEDNLARYAKYRKMTAALKSVTFCGRLAEYKYYNMDQVIARVLQLFQKNHLK